MNPKKTKNLPLSHSLLWIVGSLIFVSGFTFKGFNYYLQYQKQKAHDPSSLIRAIIQTGPQKEALATDYLAELMNISSDHSIALSQFDLKRAKIRLLQSPVIKTAEVKALPPNTLYVDYEVRKPIAKLCDYDNVAIDEEGCFFPIYPFFTPKNLPEIYLGISPFEQLEAWRVPPGNQQLKLALILLKTVLQTEVQDLVHLKRIDVSNAFAISYGIREIVLVCEDSIKDATHTRYLRLSPKNYPQELGNYLKLREQLIAKERTVHTSSVKVIDLRLSNLGYIEEL
jgi:hypothetical protein